MTLSPTQLYQIKNAKERKTKIILGAITRKYGQKIACNRKIIKFRMNEELHKQFNIQNLNGLDESQFEAYLRAIRTYRFEYGGECFG